MRKYAGFLAVLFLATLALGQDEGVKYVDSSFARLSSITGSAFIQRAQDLGYEEAVLNMPMAEGDRIGTTDGRAEIFLGRGNYIRLDKNTKLDFVNLPRKGHDLTRLRIWTGNVYLDAGRVEKEKTIELHTSDVSIYVLERGLYRIDVRENRETEIFVFRGLVEVAGEDGSVLLKSEQRIEVAEGRMTSRPSQFYAVAQDSFDRWSESRSSEIGKRLAQRYLPEELEDFEYELSMYGRWAHLNPYGYVWVPGGLGPDWRPYSYGRWVWLSLCGWTWVPYEPWGWAAFHYGRWHWSLGLGWYWIPTRIWGPAWVHWYWGYDYYGWVPLSYYGYPGVIINNIFYDRYTGDYPYHSRALTVIHKDQLKARDISRVTLGQESLKSLGKISLTDRAPAVRPETGRVTVESLEGRKVLLRKEAGVGEIRRERTDTRVIEKGSVRSPESTGAVRTGEKTPPPAEKTEAPPERKIRKKDEGMLPEASDSGRYDSGRYIERREGYIQRDSIGYPSSPDISLSRPSSREIREREKSPATSGSFVNRIYKYIHEGRTVSRGSSQRDSSSGRVTSRQDSSRQSSSSRSRDSSSSSRSSGSSSGSSGKTKKD